MSVVFHTARNGACKNNTAPPLHPKQMVVPWHRTAPMGCGALKHATGAAVSLRSPSLGGSAVISRMSPRTVRRCRLVPCSVSFLFSSKAKEPTTWRTCVPDAMSQKRTCAAPPIQPFSGTHRYQGQTRTTRTCRLDPPLKGLRTVPSSLPVMTCAPSSLNFTRVSAPEWPITGHSGFTTSS